MYDKKKLCGTHILSNIKVEFSNNLNYYSILYEKINDVLKYQQATILKLLNGNLYGVEL